MFPVSFLKLGYVFINMTSFYFKWIASKAEFWLFSGLTPWGQSHCGKWWGWGLEPRASFQLRGDAQGHQSVSQQRLEERAVWSLTWVGWTTLTVPSPDEYIGFSNIMGCLPISMAKCSLWWRKKQQKIILCWSPSHTEEGAPPHLEVCLLLYHIDTKGTWGVASWDIGLHNIRHKVINSRQWKHSSYIRVFFGSLLQTTYLGVEFRPQKKGWWKKSKEKNREREMKKDWTILSF